MSMNDLTALVNQYKEAQQLAEAAAPDLAERFTKTTTSTRVLVA